METVETVKKGGLKGGGKVGILGFNRKRKFSRIKLSFRFWFGKCGTPGWVRTSGFQLRRLTLYPLSYGRK
jgi:hypothetical protein